MENGRHKMSAIILIVEIACKLKKILSYNQQILVSLMNKFNQLRQTSLHVGY